SPGIRSVGSASVMVLVHPLRRGTALITPVADKTKSRVPSQIVNQSSVRNRNPRLNLFLVAISSLKPISLQYSRTILLYLMQQEKECVSKLAGAGGKTGMRMVDYMKMFMAEHNCRRKRKCGSRHWGP